MFLCYVTGEKTNILSRPRNCTLDTRSIYLGPINTFHRIPTRVPFLARKFHTPDTPLTVSSRTDIFPARKKVPRRSGLRLHTSFREKRSISNVIPAGRKNNAGEKKRESEIKGTENETGTAQWLHTRSRLIASAVSRHKVGSAVTFWKKI